jgi:hypothetical protein
LIAARGKIIKTSAFIRGVFQQGFTGRWAVVGGFEGGRIFDQVAQADGKDEGVVVVRGCIYRA